LSAQVAANFAAGGSGRSESLPHYCIVSVLHKARITVSGVYRNRDFSADAFYPH